METLYRAPRFPAPAGTNYDDVDLAVLYVRDEETGNDVGKVVGCRAGTLDGVVFVVDLNEVGQDLVVVAPHAGVTIGFGSTSVQAAPYTPAAAGDFVEVAPPAELEVPEDAYVTELEEALERRELGARLLDKILAEAEVEEEGDGDLRPLSFNVRINLTREEGLFYAARKRAGFEPDRSET